MKGYESAFKMVFPHFIAFVFVMIKKTEASIKIQYIKVGECVWNKGSKVFRKR